MLTANMISDEESDRFLHDVKNLKKINKSELHKLNIEIISKLHEQKIYKNTIF